MGLDFHSEGCEVDDTPHWSYSGFMGFRTRLAKLTAIGDLRTMEGFPPYEIGEDLGVIIDESVVLRSWDEIDDPIVPLINHSDCDGQLTPEECRTVAPRLRELLEQFEAGDVLNAESYDVQHGLLLAEMMEDCALRGVPLIFC